MIAAGPEREVGLVIAAGPEREVGRVIAAEPEREVGLREAQPMRGPRVGP